MTDRLVLGSSPLVPTLTAELAELPGDLHVLTTDEAIAESVRETGVSVTAAEAIDAETLESLDVPEIVAVFERSRQANRQWCQAVRQAFQGVYLIASAGTDDREHEEQIDACEHDRPLGDLADRVLDPVDVTATQIMGRVGEGSRQSRQLFGVLREIDDLAIVAHDNPDPDAIGAGVALARIAAAAGTDAEVCYFGEISHQENLALVNVLNLELRNVPDGECFEEYDGIALVDHSRPGVNDQLPVDTPVDIVIDHHPPRSPIDARFVDLRSDVGATSTLLVEYLDRFGIEPTEDVATALLFGIHVDTDGFSREVSQQDFEAAATLVPAVDFGTLERIETPNVSPTTLETIASAITRRWVEGTVLVSGVGTLHERDALAQAADQLLNLDGVTTTLVYGVKDGTIFISARARGADIDLGETLREAFDQIGSAGGHVDMAGAQIDLGVLEAVDEDNVSLYEVVDEVVTSRFLDVLETQTTYKLKGVYHGASSSSVEYLTAEAEAIEAELETGKRSEETTDDQPSPEESDDAPEKSDDAPEESDGASDGSGDAPDESSDQQVRPGDS
jgi:nanoRNase/pAp phosphatase (c-di-AMP/oligoRNAs hydrolase)